MYRSIPIIFLVALCGLGHARDLYVSTNGTPVPPYTSPETAATSIVDAVSVATNSDVIHIADGQWVSSIYLQITNGITLRGDNGPGSVALRWSEIIRVNHADARLEGLTIRFAAVYNSYVNLQTGTVTNCWIRDKTYRWPALYIGSGGLVTHSRIVNNYAINGVEKNSGVVMTGGVLQYSVVSNNTAEADSSGVYLSSGTPLVRNCLIARNTSVNWPGAGIYIAKNVAARVESCTIVDNASPVGAACGGVYSAATTAGEVKHAITNCIIYGNRVGVMTGDCGGAWTGHPNAYAFSCGPELPAGVRGNSAGNPYLLNAATSNYRLSIVSPCLDAGSNLDWMVSATDLDGTNRVAAFQGNPTAIADMGCYEKVISPGDPLETAFLYSPQVGRTSLDVTFSPKVAGGNTNVAWYGFDFENDGIWDVQQVGQPLPTSIVRTLGVGSYPVKLSVSNNISQNAQSVLATPLVVHPTIYYLSPGGSNSAPYDTLAKAATNFDALMTYARGSDTGETISVIMADGTHTNRARTQVQKALHIRSTNGPENAVLRIGGEGQYRLEVSHSNAVLEGVTLIEDGSLGYGLLFVYAGTVTNCIVRDYNGLDSVVKNSGKITHSIIRNNVSSQGGAESTGSIYVYGNGVLEYCRIFGNRSAKAGGAVQLLGSGVLRNCLVYSNTATGTGGGGVYAVGAGSGARVEFCTIVSNVCPAAYTGGGIYNGATLLACTNTIVYWNRLSDGQRSDVSGDITRYAYSCAPELTNAANLNLTDDPAFVNAATGNCHLARTSPCLDAGMALAGVDVALDLDGAPRLQGRRVDMGVYEGSRSPGTMVLLR